MKLISESYTPPPVSEGKHTLTLELTESERTMLIQIVRSGRERKWPNASYLLVGWEFLKLLGAAH